MVPWVKKFLDTHSITAHSIAVVVTMVVTAFYEVPQFHDAVVGAYGHFPQWAKTLVTVGIALVMWYRNTHKSWDGVDRRNGQSTGTGAGAGK